MRWAIIFCFAIGCALTVRVLVRPDSHTVYPVLATASERWWNDITLYGDERPWLDCCRYPPVLAIVLLFAALWPRQLIFRIAAIVALSLLVPFLTRPPTVVYDQYIAWIDQLRTLSHERWPGFRDGWTVWIVIERLAAGDAGLPDL